MSADYIRFDGWYCDALFRLYPYGIARDSLYPAYNTYCLSKGQSWVISYTNLMKHSPALRTALQMKNGTEAGYYIMPLHKMDSFLRSLPTAKRTALIQKKFNLRMHELHPVGICEDEFEQFITEWIGGSPTLVCSHITKKRFRCGNRTYILSSDQTEPTKHSLMCTPWKLKCFICIVCLVTIYSHLTTTG